VARGRGNSEYPENPRWYNDNRTDSEPRGGRDFSAFFASSICKKVI
jgi:hypothetical protein